MKILFKTNSLNFRGTTTAIVDYATHARKILGHEVIIGYNETIPHEIDMGNEPVVIHNLKSDFKLVNCVEDNIQEVIEEEKVDLIYQLGSGEPIYNRTKVKQVHHAVFQYKNDTIDAYISKWLSNHMTNGKVPYVSHMIDLPPPTKDFRFELGIPEDALVIGRHGGFHTFDIPFAKAVVDRLGKEVYFLMANTARFSNSRRVKYINAINGKQKLSNFINTCDAMIHARSRGESFGLAIAEALSQNKPVYAWKGGIDKNHLTLTKYLYDDESSLEQLIRNTANIKDKDHRSSVKNFTPKKVMESFNKYFIEGK